MSGIILHNNRILQGKSIDYELIDDFPVYEDYPAVEYTRPLDWLALPSVSEGEQVIHMLVAVYENSPNWLAFNVALTSPGTYSVNWGDGTITGSVASNTISRYDIQWSGISSGTFTSRGYRQAIVTISATQSSVFNSFSLNVAQYPDIYIPVDSQSARTPYSNSGKNAVLDIKMSGATFSSISLGPSYTNKIEQFEFVGTNSITNFSNMFLSMKSIRKVKDIYTGLGTNFSQMFSDCPNLVEMPPNLEMGSATNMYRMFADCTLIRNISSMTPSNVTNMEQMFAKCINMDVAPYFDTSGVINMRFMFANCHYLNKFKGWNFLSYPIPSVYYNTQNVTNMDGMFWKCHSLQTIPQFNTTNVATMSYMFYQNTSLQSLPAGLTTSSVKNMRGMFRECHSLVNDTRMNGVPYMDTSSVTDMKEMFYQCYRVKTIPLFNTSNVTDMSLMFYNCIALQDLPLLNTATCSNMYQMFAYCHRLETIPQFNTINVKSMSQMFYDCHSLRELPLLNTSNVVNMHQMFLQNVPFNGSGYNVNRGSLKTIPLFDTSKVVTMYQMFYNCRSLQHIPELNTSSLRNMYQMFWNCTNLRSIKMVGLYGLTGPAANLGIVYSNAYGVNIAYPNQTTYIGFDLNIAPYYTYLPDTSFSTGLNFTEMFKDCINLRKVEIVAPTVTDATTMFSGCINLRKGISLTFSTNLIKTNSMFINCYRLKEAPLFETSYVTDMNYMFHKCYELLNVPLYNTIRVTTMYSMFNNSENGAYNGLSRGALTSVPLFDTRNVTNMGTMFVGCRNLKTIPAFNTVNVTNMSYMFSGCFGLKTIPILNLPVLNYTAVAYNTVIAEKGLNRTFFNCVSLEYIPATFTYSIVVDMVETFNGCSRLRYIEEPFKIKPYRLYKTFNGCSLLDKIPPMDVSSCVNFKYAFSDCFNLTEVSGFTMSAIVVASSNFTEQAGNSSYNYEAGDQTNYSEYSPYPTFRTIGLFSSNPRISKLSPIYFRSSLVLNGLSLNYSEILKIFNNATYSNAAYYNFTLHANAFDARIVDIRRNPGTAQLRYIDRKIMYDKYWILPGYGYQYDRVNGWRHPIAALGESYVASNGAGARPIPMFYHFTTSAEPYGANKIVANNMPISIASESYITIASVNYYFGAFYIPEPANTDKHSIDNGAPSNVVLDWYNTRIYDFWTWKIGSTYSQSLPGGGFFSATAAQANYLAAGNHALTHSVYPVGNQHKYDLTTYVNSLYSEPTVILGSASYRTTGAVYDGTLGSKWMRKLLQSVPSNPSWRYPSYTSPISNVWFKFRPEQTGTVNFSVWTGPSSSNVVYGTQRRSQIAIWESDGVTELSSSGWTYSLGLIYSTFSSPQHYTIEYMSITASSLVTASTWYYISVDVAFDANQGTFTLATWWI